MIHQGKQIRKCVNNVLSAQEALFGSQRRIAKAELLDGLAVVQMQSCNLSMDA